MPDPLVVPGAPGVPGAETPGQEPASMPGEVTTASVVTSLIYRPVLCRWGYRLHLITYCARCDGSLNEARERGRPFRADRWRFHRKHERAFNDEHGAAPLLPERRRVRAPKPVR